MAVLVFILAFVGIYLIFSAPLPGFAARIRPSGALAEAAPPPEDAPFRERVIIPALLSLGRMLERMAPREARRRTEAKLTAAGKPWGVETHFLLRGAFMVAAFLPVVFGGTKAILTTVILAVLAYRLPDFWAERRATQRRVRFLRHFPDALDLLAVSVEAGLGFEAAMDKVARKFPGPVAQEFGQVLSEIRLGRPRREALKAMGARIDLPELRTFIGAMNQAEEMGVGVLEVLRTQAESLRVRRAQAIQERVMKIPIKMLFPLIFFVLPALFVVLMGPMALSLRRGLGGL